MEPATSNMTSQLATFITSLKISDIPSSIQETATSLILDTVGCLRGGALTPIAGQVTAASSIFGGPGKASVAGRLELVGAAQALYVNARLSNLLDMDETFPTGAHFGVAAACAAIAALETKEKGSQECCGAELLVGVIAACVAYARTLGPDVVDAATLEQALGIAVSNTPLPIGHRWSDSVQVADCKYCDAGWCAVAGMHSVVSAMASLTGFASILDGDVGLAEACGAQMPRPESLTEQLGMLWYLADITFKPWPTCRWIHAPQTALRRLLGKHRPALEDIKEVVVFTNPVADGALFRNPSPSTFCGYSFSYQHAVAAMLLNIPSGRRWFDPEFAESEAAVQARKMVRVERLQGAESFARDMVRNQIRTMPGAVTVRTVQGQNWTESTEYSDGDPWNADTLYDRQKVIDKFRMSTDSPDAQELLDWISELQSRTTLDPLSLFIRKSGLNKTGTGLKKSIANLQQSLEALAAMAIAAVGQICATASIKGNLEQCVRLVAKAARGGAKVLFLPEASDYIAPDGQTSLRLAEPQSTSPFVKGLQQAAREHSVAVHVGIHHRGAAEAEADAQPSTEAVHRILNRALYITADGDIDNAATYDKLHVFDYGSLKESATVQPGPAVTPPFDSPIGRIGSLICFDLRFPETALTLAQPGPSSPWTSRPAQILTYPSAFTLRTGAAHWETLLRARAIETQSYVVAAAQVGRHNEKRASWGQSIVADPWGRVVLKLKGVVEVRPGDDVPEGTAEEGAEGEIGFVDIDLDALERVRREMPLQRRT
ncbi:hydrolase nit2 [Fusarium albosuccineum]|uniref:Hydrolase nit2 n=1 Tax=Fusarium albosuccineum TaxID=1237068 RepID=A0A8H4LP12_9HYPO|nr:hydrolase nit2 [Fusarium albosuccineum]